MGSSVLALTLSVFTVGVAVAAAAPSHFSFHAGDGLGGTMGPDVTSASNGATITIKARGNFDAASHKASGGGTFQVKAPSGKLTSSGTFTATGLKSFHPYGCDTSGFPKNYCGGLAVFRAHVVEHVASGRTKQLNTVFAIDCKIGHQPKAAMEVITFDLPGLDFDTPVSGDNVFVKHVT